MQKNEKMENSIILSYNGMNEWMKNDAYLYFPVRERENKTNSSTSS